MNDDMLHQVSRQTTRGFKLRKLLSTGKKRGVALIITLAFILLLTGVVVAFFSKAMTGSQVSSASAGRVRADLLADGAVDTIISDLRQESVVCSSALRIT